MLATLRSAPLLSCAIALLIAVALLFGGGSVAGGGGDLIVQLSALPAFALALLQFPSWSGLSPSGRHAVVWIALVVALFFIQLLPLPQSFWISLAGRGEIFQELAVASLRPATTSISLTPFATERALWSLLPALATFLGVLSLTARARILLAQMVVGIAALSVIYGLFQIAGGPDSALRLYSYTHRADAVGFFANRNHFAALLYVCLALALAWLIGLFRERNDGRSINGLVLAGVALLAMIMILGLALARSRAGIGGEMLTLLACSALIWRMRGPRGRGAARWVYAVGLAGVACAAQFGLYGILERFDRDPLQDGRWTMLATTMEAADHFGTLGSGFGTFINAYQRVETPANTMSTFANQAHNDWVQWWLEGGIPAAVLAILFLLWLAAGSWRAWRSNNGRPLLLSFNRAASIAIVVLLLHAFVDYSLRTQAIQCVAALLCGLIAAAGTNYGETRVSRTGSAESFRRRRGEPSPTTA